MSSGQGKKKDFFISYTQADRRWAGWIAWQLEEAGYSVVLQAWDFRPGSNFVLEMHRALARAGRTIAVLSPDYLRSVWAQPEWAAAFDPFGQEGTLMPVLVRECTPEGLLARLVQIRLVGLAEAAAGEALQKGVRRDRAKPDKPPAFPAAGERSVPTQPRFPGALPPIWNVPHRRNPNFTGRGALLKDLGKAWASGQPAALTQVITGLGGVGKTQLAVEYAYRHAAGYRLVWWVRAEEPATLASDYAALAGELGLPQRELGDQRLVIGAVRRWLEQNGEWLLVFDNAVDPGALGDYLPRGVTGDVLVTSRNPNWGASARALPVEVMPRSEAVEFLYRRTGQADEAPALAEELGGLPLALEQAAAYVEATGRRLVDYLELLRTRREELWERAGPPPGYPDTVATTWDLSFQRVEEKSAAGADLLRLCAFLAPDDIPRGLLGQGAQGLPGSLSSALADPLRFDAAVAALRRYSLVQVSEDALSVHRLVQAVVRGGLAKGSVARHPVAGDCKAWSEAAMCLINNAFPMENYNPATWSECERLLPHALAAIKRAEDADAVACEAAAQLLTQAGLYLRNRAHFSQAKDLLERAFKIAVAVYPSTDPIVADFLNNVGVVLQEVGDLPAALAHFERALETLETAEHHYGTMGHAAAEVLNNLGVVCWKRGDLRGARGYLEQALSVAGGTPDHPVLADIMNNLGLALRALGDLKGAQAQFEQALLTARAAYGPDHPKVASVANGLGDVLRRLGRLGDAKELLDWALKADEATFGGEHPKVGPDAHNLGLLYLDMGDLEQAQACLERALAIHEKSYGRDNPKVATDVNSLGVVLLERGDLESARQHFERALSICEAVHRGGTYTVDSIHNLGLVLWRCGDVSGGRDCLERAVRVCESQFGADYPHPKAAICASNLGRLLLELGESEKARIYLDRACKINAAVYGPDAPQMRHMALTTSAGSFGPFGIRPGRQ